MSTALSNPGLPPCDQCDATCCRYMAIQIDRPVDGRDIDDIRWYLLHRDVSVCIDAEGDWFVAFDTPCEALGDDGLCSRYDTRPQLCRDHGQPPESCEYHGPLFVEQFSALEAFESWLSTTGNVQYSAFNGDD